MHKLVKITATFAALTLFFSATFTAHAEAPTIGQIITGNAINVLTGGTVPTSVAIPLAQIGGGGSPSIGSIAGAAKDTATNIGGQFLSWISVKVIGYVLFVISYIAGFIGSTVFTLAGLFVAFGLYLNTTILDGEVVQLGWRFCRDLANLGFTIGIVVIAYATMLGIESYGMKKLIQNFVIAAVMVNFSFSIAGFAIDMSNMLTHFFVNAAIGGGAGEVGVDSIKKFTETLASTFSPQKLLITNSGNIEVYKSLSSNDGMIAAVLSIFFVALFTAFAALGMLMVGLTTISRFVYLSGLIIIMPLAVLCYAFPNTKKYWGEWYQKFTCQLTYLPTATFTMYIIIMFVQVKSNIGFGNAQAVDLKNLLETFEAAKGAPGGLTSTRTLELMAAPFRTITDMILVLTMLFYGITKSRNIGCAGGDIALKWAQGLKGWAVGTATGAPAWAGRKVLSGGLDEKDQNRGTRLANIMSSIPLVRRLVPRLNNFAAGTSKNIGNFETEYKGLGDVQLLNNLRSVEIRTNSERMAAAAKVAAERGLFSEDDPEKGLTQKEFEAFIPAAKRYGLDKDILKKMPHLYGKFGLNVTKENGEYVNKEDGKKLDDAIKGLKPEDVESLPIEAFADSEVVKRLSGTQLEKLPKGKEHRAAFSQTLDRLSKDMDAAKFAEYMTKAFGKSEAIDILTPESFKNGRIVRNLTNVHLKKLKDPNKAEHRRALLDTVNDPSKFTDADLRDFAKNNFGKPKDIEDLHPDFIGDKVFFRNFLSEKHIEQLNKEPDTKQQIAILEGLQKSYTEVDKGNYSDNAIKEIDKMAGKIIGKKQDFQWSTIAEATETKELFAKIEANYHKRNPEEVSQQKTDQTQKKEKGWWEDDDNGSNPPSAGPQQPPKNPPPPAPPAGKSTAAETYKLAPQQPAQPVTPPAQSAPNAPQATSPGKPPRATPEEQETRTGKGPDIGATIDEMFKKSAERQESETKPIMNTPEPKELDADYLESLEAATNPQSAQKPQAQVIPKTQTPKVNEPTKIEVIPITPPELNRLAESEKIRIGRNTNLIIPKRVEPEQTASSESIEIDFSRITNKGITDKGPLVPPEQKPTSVPEPLKTISEWERNANENQLSVIPKFQPVNQPKRITYEGPVTPPPAPTLPEPIRSILQDEKNTKDNQERGKNTI